MTGPASAPGSDDRSPTRRRRRRATAAQGAPPAAAAGRAEPGAVDFGRSTTTGGRRGRDGSRRTADVRSDEKPRADRDRRQVRPEQKSRPEPKSRAEQKSRAEDDHRRRAEPHGAHREERGARDIVGAGRSQLGVDAALRARDVNRPTDDDLRAAAAEVVIVRRNWAPEPGQGPRNRH